jgi:hypothetical protein
MNTTSRIQIVIILLIAIFSFLFGAYAHQKKYIAQARLFALDLVSENAIPTPTEPAQGLISNPGLYPENKYLSLNELPLEVDHDPLSFLVAGHVYGSHDENELHPALNLLTNVQLINKMDLDMVLILGDMVPDSTEEEFNNFEYYFLSYLDVPVFNAVGNHDVAYRDVYLRRYGETVYSFSHKDHLFIFLDTTIEYCSITSDQYEYISAVVEIARSNPATKGIHLLLHHVLFLDQNTLTNEKKSMPNETCPPSSDFDVYVSDFLAPVSAHIPVYLYSGDVGAWDGNLSPYYEKILGTNITRIATGLGQHESDSVVIAREINGVLIYETLKLSDAKIYSIENYDYQYWVNQSH